VLDEISAIEPATLQFEIKAGSENFVANASAIAFSDAKADLLILNVPTPLADRKHLCFLGKSQEGTLEISETRIYTSGFPDAIPYINTDGLITSFQGPGNTWLTSVPIYAGQSGSPIYTASGQVMGLAKGEEKKLPGMFAIIPVSSIRTQIANYASDCAAPNTNIVVKGPQAISLSSSSLPKTSECVFLGKLSALTTKAVDEAPFGIPLVAKMNDGGKLLPSDLKAVADVNVRSNCPIIRDNGGYYGTITRAVKAGTVVPVKEYLPFKYAQDTFYWGIIGN
jgi:hypothetical protein